MKSKIKFCTVNKYFQKTHVLRDVSFQIEEGEIMGLLGPSGAGKTTIINILTGQLKPESGKIEINGEELLPGHHQSYEDFGVILENPGLYERLSCYDNLTVFADIHHIQRCEIDGVLKQVGLFESRKKQAGKLSKGMKQRLALARAVLHKPKILLLDEPTGALDPSTSRQIHELISEQKRRGTAILLTTHNMEEAKKLCGHIALLHEGKIIEYGKPDEICRKYNHQKKIYILLKNGQTLEVSSQSQSADVVRKYLQDEQIESIHSSEPNLETVFMELTGKELEV